MANPFGAAQLATTAQQKEGLQNRGPLPFQEPLAVFADGYAAADLNDIGVHALRSGVVHMHRDPRENIPSGASLNATLHAMHSDHVNRDHVGAEWLQRMGWTNDRAMATRPGWVDGSTTCTDIEFADAVADPIGQVSRVYDAIGVPLTAAEELAMRRRLVERPCEPARPPYSATDFGLNDAQIDERFATYNSRFRSGAEPFRRI